MINVKNGTNKRFLSYTDFFVWMSGRRGTGLVTPSDYARLAMHDGSRYKVFLKFYDRYRDACPELLLEVVGRKGEEDGNLSQIWVVRAILKGAGDETRKTKIIFGHSAFSLLSLQAGHNRRMFNLRRKWENRGIEDDDSDAEDDWARSAQPS